MGNVKVSKDILNRGLFLIAGPCVIESYSVCEDVAGYCKEIAEKYGLFYIFKSSYDKANRTSVSSYRGPGIDEGLKILSNIKKNIGVPILTDVHLPSEVNMAKDVIDVLQIPAFLCRQTDLLLLAGESGRWVNVKKGQFLSPWDMRYVVEKLCSVGCDKIMLTERGTSFGYNNLVNDFRSLVVMRDFCDFIVFDATHSVQLPGGGGSCSSGMRQFIRPLLRAAVAVGVSGIFMEVHPNPDTALCDGANSLPLDELEDVIKEVVAIDGSLKKVYK